MIDEAFTFDDLLENDTPAEETEQTEDNSFQSVDDLVDTPKETETEPENNDVPDYSNDSLYRFLQDRGIKDPSKLQFKNQDGTTAEEDFRKLSVEEQLEILNQMTDPGLSATEINTINFLRKNNVNLNQVIDYYSQKAVQDYLNQHPDQVYHKTYEIDDYTDDELFAIDLKSRYPDLTDEEILSELDSAKENEELFKKKSEILRNTYKAQQDQADAEREQLEAQQMEDLRNNLMNAVGRFNEIQLDYTDDKSDSLVIDDTDKQQMMSYLLDQDSEGKSAFIRSLEDPDQLIELAWFATQGPKVLSDLTQYWKGLLAEQRAENKKLQSKLDRITGKTNTTIVPKQKKDPNQVTDVHYISGWDNSGLI